MGGSVVLQIVIGLISLGLSVGFVIWMENTRKPKLALTIVDPVNDSYPAGKPANKIRWLRLMVENKQLPRLLKWLSRNPAFHCSGSITFHHLDGQNVFGRCMPARWFDPREPLPIPIVDKNWKERLYILDPVRLAPEIYRNIYLEAPEKLDVVARFDNDGECYGWCNENYRSDPLWRTPNWKLSPRRYLVEVTISCAGEKHDYVFRLINDVPVDAFRFEKAQPGDRKKVCKNA